MTGVCISVVIPVFNRPVTVGEAVASTLDQGIDGLEIVLVDDGSSDGRCATAVAGLAARHAAVRAVLLDANLGPSAARNRGVAESVGELVAFLDSDDLMADGRLRRQRALMIAEPDLDVVTGLCDTQVLPGVEPTEMSRRELEQFGPLRPYIMSMMVRRSAFEGVSGFDESLRFAEDVDLLYRLASRGEVRHVEEILTHYRVVGDNLTYDTAAVRRSLFEVLRRRRRSSDDVRGRVENEPSTPG